MLSPSTASFGRGEKLERYKEDRSLTEHVQVSSERMRVEHYVRQNGETWLYREYHEGSEILTLASVGVELPLAEIYERVAFAEQSA